MNSNSYIFFQARQFLQTIVVQLRHKRKKNTLFRDAESFQVACLIYQFFLWIFLVPEFLEAVPNSKEFEQSIVHLRTRLEEIQDEEKIQSRINLQAGAKSLTVTDVLNLLNALFTFHEKLMSLQITPADLAQEKNTFFSGASAPTSFFFEESVTSQNDKLFSEILNLEDLLLKNPSHVVRLTKPSTQKDLGPQPRTSLESLLKIRLRPDYRPALPELKKALPGAEWKIFQQIHSIYFPLQRLRAVQRTFFMPTKPQNLAGLLRSEDGFSLSREELRTFVEGLTNFQKIRETLCELYQITQDVSKTTTKNARRYKNASFFLRLFQARERSFKRALTYQKLFCQSAPAARGFSDFLKHAGNQYLSTQSGDVLDDGFQLCVRSEIPLLLGQDGTILTGVFQGAFLNHQYVQPDVSDCITVQTQRFRARLKRPAHYRGYTNPIEALLQGQITKKLCAEDEIYSGPIYEDTEFQHCPGLFWTRFCVFHKESLYTDQNPSATAQFALKLLQALESNGVCLEKVHRVVITEFDGFFFAAAPFQYSVFQARLPYLFSLPSQFETKPLRNVWFQETSKLYKTQQRILLNWTASDQSELEKQLIEHFYTRKEIFLKKVVEPYLLDILKEPIYPIWCKLAHQTSCQDLQETLLCLNPTSRSRFFTLLPSNQTKLYQEEHDLLLSADLFRYGSNNCANGSSGNFQPKALQILLESSILPFFLRNKSLQQVGLRKRPKKTQEIIRFYIHERSKILGRTSR